MEPASQQRTHTARDPGEQLGKLRRGPVDRRVAGVVDRRDAPDSRSDSPPQRSLDELPCLLAEEAPLVGRNRGAGKRRAAGVRRPLDGCIVARCGGARPVHDDRADELRPGPRRIRPDVVELLDRLGDRVRA